MLGLNDVGQEQFDTDIACAALSSFVVALRIYCKLRHKQGVRSDDWSILVALGCFWASVGCVTWGRVAWGNLEELMLLLETQDNTDMSAQMSDYLKALLIGNTCLLAAFFACRVSVLMFYRHLFFISGTYRHLTLAMLILSTTWFLATLITNWLSCIPIQAFWDRTLPGKCIDFNAYCLAVGIIDTIIDLLIIMLPIRMALRLQLPRKTKIAIAGVFALGGFVVVTDIMRTVYIYQPGEAFISSIEAERWSNIHMVTAFTCACLPVYKPLWSSFTGKASGWVKRGAGSGSALPEFSGTPTNLDLDFRARDSGSSSAESPRTREEENDRGYSFKSDTSQSTDDNGIERGLYL